MLDLFRSRDTSMRYLLVVLLSLVALSMIITLVPGFGSPSFQRNEAALGTVCGQEITSSMVNQIIQGQLRQNMLSRGTLDLAVPQVVNQMVGEMATSCQARELGFSVSDSEMINMIRLAMPMLFQGGEFVGKEAYLAFLARNNTTVQEFESRIRQQVLLDKLQRIAFDGVVVTPKEVEAEFAKRSEKVKIDVIKLDSEELRKEIKLSPNEVEEFFKANAKNYQTQPSVAATLLVADADKMGESLAIPDQELRNLYGTQLSRFKTDERVRARHILIKADEKASKEEKDKAKAKAEDLLKQIKSGKDFAELAKKNSDDTSNASKGGDLDWFGKGQMVKPFEDAAFALKAKETSGVVESPFGYHIIQGIDKEAARTKTFEEVKNDLVTEYRQRQLFDKLPGIMDQARTELSSAPGQAAAIAQKLGLQTGKIDKWTVNIAYPVIGASRELDMALANLPKGKVTEVIQTPNNRLVIAVVDEFFPQRQAELKDVEAQVRDTLLAQKSNALLEKRAQEIEDKLRAAAGDIRKVASDLKLKLVTSNEFTRTGQIEGVGPAGYFGEQPFVSPVGHVVTKYRVGTSRFFFKILSRTPGSLAELEKERQTIVAIVRETKLRERRELFEEGMVRQLKASGKIKLNEDAVKRLAAAFRG